MAYVVYFALNMTEKSKNKRLKPTALFLSLGLVATLATACGGPTEDTEIDGDVGEPIEEPLEEEPLEEEPLEEGGEGGEE